MKLQLTDENGKSVSIDPDNLEMTLPELREFILMISKDTSEPPDYGDYFSMDEFIERVDNLCFIDYDGSGDLVIDNKIIDCSGTWLGMEAIVFNRFFIFPMKKIRDAFEGHEKVGVMWYNK